MKIGILDRAWVHSTTKRAESLYQRTVVAPVTDPEQYWEIQLPNRGQMIMSVLGQFYDWKPELQQPSEDFDRQASDIVFWRPVKNLRLVRSNEVVELDTTLNQSLKKGFHGIYRYDVINSCLRTSLGARLEEPFRRSFEAGREMNFVDSVWSSLLATLVVPCMYCARYKIEKVAKFDLLLDLWLAGNYPLGFDEDSNLLVLAL